MWCIGIGSGEVAVSSTVACGVGGIHLSGRSTAIVDTLVHIACVVWIKYASCPSLQSGIGVACVVFVVALWIFSNYLDLNVVVFPVNAMRWKVRNDILLSAYLLSPR